MRRFFPASELARDERFNTVTMRERARRPPWRQPRSGGRRAAHGRSSNRLTPSRKDASDTARALMHGIFVGEIQALEGAGRTCFDFDVRSRRADAAGDAPTPCRSPSSSTWPASAGTRPATSRSR